jgi:hypothetical protein
MTDPSRANEVYCCYQFEMQVEDGLSAQAIKDAVDAELDDRSESSSKFWPANAKELSSAQVRREPAAERGVGLSALRYVLQRTTGKGTIFPAGPAAMLATKELAPYYFNGRSSYASPNAHRFGKVVPMGPALSAFYLVLSELPYRGVEGELRVDWIDGRRTEFSCGMARCNTCEQMAR